MLDPLCKGAQAFVVGSGVIISHVYPLEVVTYLCCIKLFLLINAVTITFGSFPLIAPEISAV